MPDSSPEQITLSARQLADVALSTIRSVLGTERYQYLSGPITGGRRLVDWHLSIGRTLPDEERSAARRAAVTRANIDEIARLAAKEREAGRRTIEPGSFEADLEHWGQPEFYAFWDRVLEDHAAVAVFADGWEFSAGCSFEYERARYHGIRTVDIRGADLLPDAAVRMLDGAVSDLEAAADRSDPRDRSLVDLLEGIGTQCRSIADRR